MDEGNEEKIFCQIPFSSFNKFNVLIRDMRSSPEETDESKRHLMLVLKGAPERVINRCSRILLKGKEESEFTDKYRNQVMEANKELAALGERVLAFSRVYLDPE